MAPASSKLESILAHFGGSQTPAGARSRRFHAAVLATRAAARARRLRVLPRPALAARGARARALPASERAPRAPPRCVVDARARPVQRRATQATSTPRLDGAGPG